LKPITAVPLRVAELALTTGHRPDRQILSHGLTLSRRASLRPHVEVRMLGVLVEAAPVARGGVSLVSIALGQRLIPVAIVTLFAWIAVVAARLRAPHAEG
jgi:hypothetical protein